MRQGFKLLLLILLLGCISVLPAGYARNLKVGVSSEFPPYEFIDDNGRITGADIDILKAVAKDAKLSVRLVADDRNNIRNQFEEGKLNMLAGMVKTPDREPYYLFTEPHSYIHYSIFTRSGSEILRGWGSLNGKRLLVEAGSVVEEQLRSKGIKSILLRTPNFREAMERLSNGAGDAVIMPRIQGYYYIGKLKLDNLIESYTLGDALPYCFALPLGNEELRDRLNQSLQKLSDNYRLLSIQGKWFGIYSSNVSSLDRHSRYYRILLVTLILGLVVITFFIFRLVKRILQQRKYLTLQIVERNNYEREFNQRHQLFVSGPIVFLKWNDANREIFDSISDNFAMFGYSPEDILSSKLNFRSIIHPDDLERISLERQQYMDKARTHYFQIYRLICPSLEEFSHAGEVVNTWHNRNHVLSNCNTVQVRWVYDYTVAMSDTITKTHHYYGYMLDISGQKEVESELARQNQASQEAMNTKDVFLTGISVEINSPLNALIGLSRKIGNEGLDDEQKAAFQIITNSALHLKQILQQIHDFLNILKGSMGSVPQWYVMHSLLEPIIYEYQIKIASKRLAFEYNEYQPAAFVFLDADWFQKILRIILDNSLKFTDRGKIALTIDIARHKSDMDEITVKIADTGVGIPPDKLQMILEPFTQVDETYTRRYGGIGLGLSIARNLLIQMNGKIHLESTPGNGTTVLLHFPVQTRF
jgi:signal transduction histidine kinase